MTYKIVKCPNCKNYAMTSADKVFKCIICSKTTDITKMKIHFQSDSPQAVTQVLQKIKQEEFIRDHGNPKDDDYFM
jgi:hypothetical protein